MTDADLAPVIRFISVTAAWEVVWIPERTGTPRRTGNRLTEVKWGRNRPELFFGTGELFCVPGGLTPLRLCVSESSLGGTSATVTGCGNLGASGVDCCGCPTVTFSAGTGTRCVGLVVVKEGGASNPGLFCISLDDTPPPA